MSLVDDGGTILPVRDIEICIADSLVLPDSSLRRIYLYKDRTLLSTMAAIVEQVAPRRMLEIGIKAGGSTLYWAERFAPERLIAIDLAKDAPYLVDYLRRHALTERVRPFFGVRQDDAETLRSILHREIGEARLDLIIDDASHAQWETRASTEALLPFLRPGGCYIIEDWAWAQHRAALGGKFQAMLSMSPLVTELTLICGRRGGVINSLDIRPQFIVLWRGDALLPTDGSFRLTDHYSVDE